jgi:deazaflavin-dependent oxidoreductase (nitroreductase family)
MSTEDTSKGRSPGQAQTLSGQGLVNKLIRTLLSTPGVARGIGKKLILLDVVGRKSGKHYEIPIAYTHHDGAILIGTQFPWVRNLRTGEPIEVRYLGKRRTADVEVISDEAGVVQDYGVLCRDNRQFAKFHNIGFEAGGEPRPADLHATWRAGSRVVRLTLR